MSQTRRLAAILAADVAGYSRLMGADEEGTLERLKALRRELLDPKLAEHHGRIVKTGSTSITVTSLPSMASEASLHERWSASSRAAAARKPTLSTIYATTETTDGWPAARSAARAPIEWPSRHTGTPYRSATRSSAHSTSVTGRIRAERYMFALIANAYRTRFTANGTRRHPRATAKRPHHSFQRVGCS